MCKLFYFGFPFIYGDVCQGREALSQKKTGYGHGGAETTLWHLQCNDEKQFSIFLTSNNQVSVDTLMHSA